MTDPASTDGGGPAAAPALAIRVVHEPAPVAGLAARLQIAVGGDDPARVSLKLHIPEDQVRIALDAGQVTGQLLAALCLTYGIDGHWLLTGEGLPRQPGPMSLATSALPTQALLEEISRRLDQMIRVVGSDPAAQTPRAMAHSPQETRNPDGHEWL